MDFINIQPIDNINQLPIQPAHVQPQTSNYCEQVTRVSAGVFGAMSVIFGWMHSAVVKDDPNSSASLSDYVIIYGSVFFGSAIVFSSYFSCRRSQ